MKKSALNKDRLRIIGYQVGIGICIIFVVAFLTSQIIMPILFGKAKSIIVPNVVGIKISQAKRVLTDDKLHAVVNDSTWSEEFPVGQILSQKPEAGEKSKPDGTVYMVISRGSKSVIVPEIIGLNVQAAWILLRKAGLRFTVADSLFSDLYPINTIVQSNPSTGLRVERKTRIKLYISKGVGKTNDSLSYTP